MHISQILLVFVATILATSGQDVRNCKYVTIPVCGDEVVTTSMGDLVDGERSSKGAVGAPGKRGPQGPVGPRGQKGETGTQGRDGENANPRDIEDIVNRKLKEREAEILKMTGSEFCLTAEAGVHMVNGDLFPCDGQGWTVIQKRRDGAINFERNWQNYREGFGSLNGEFWLGLDKLYKTMYGRQCKLRVDLESFDQENAHAEYTSFSIGDEGQKFRLSISGYSGTAGDSMAFSNGMMFSTKDADNDIHGSHPCAPSHGGWWFKDCFRASLNAPWGRSTGRWKNIIWNSWKGESEAMKSSSMKIRCD